MNRRSAPRDKKRSVAKSRRLRLEKYEDRRLLAGPSDHVDGNFANTPAEVSRSANLHAPTTLHSNSNFTANQDYYLAERGIIGSNFQDAVTIGSAPTEDALAYEDRIAVNRGGDQDQHLAPGTLGLNSSNSEHIPSPKPNATRLSEIAVVGTNRHEALNQERSETLNQDTPIHAAGDLVDESIPQDVEIVRLATSSEIFGHGIGSFHSREAADQSSAQIPDPASSETIRQDATHRHIAANTPSNNATVPSAVRNSMNRHVAIPVSLVSMQHAEVSLAFETSGDSAAAGSASNDSSQSPTPHDISVIGSQQVLSHPDSSVQPMERSTNSVETDRSTLSYTRLTGGPTVLIVAATIWAKTRAGDDSQKQKKRAKRVRQGRFENASE